MMQGIAEISSGQAEIRPAALDSESQLNWYAVYTSPQHEKSALKQLNIRGIEAFLPTYESVRGWKNRQRIRLTLPLFPTYLFVRVNLRQRISVLQSPGVLRIVGNRRQSVPLRDCEIEFLRAGVFGNQIEPFRELVVGERVRIKSGVMQGLEGTLVRRSNSLKFVLTLALINQNAAVQVNAEDLEPVTN